MKFYMRRGILLIELVIMSKFKRIIIISSSKEDDNEVLNGFKMKWTCENRRSTFTSVIAIWKYFAAIAYKRLYFFLLSQNGKSFSLEFNFISFAYSFYSCWKLSLEVVVSWVDLEWDPVSQASRRNPTHHYLHLRLGIKITYNTAIMNASLHHYCVLIMKEKERE